MVSAMRHYRPVDTGLGPYSKPHVLAHMDQRTREARLVAATREELVAHVGGKPNAVQARLIHQACQLALRIALMDRKFLAEGDPTEHDSRTYLAWSAHYGRLLCQLGLAAAPSQAAAGLPRLLSGMTTPDQAAQPSSRSTRSATAA